MEKNWLVIIIVSFVAIAVIVFLVKRNQKDKKAFIKTLNTDDAKPEEHED